MFRVDPVNGVIRRRGEPVDLTRKQFELAAFLFRNAGRLVSRGHIMESVWKQSANLNTRTIDTHISKVRTRLGLNPANGWRLRSIYHHGYRLERLPGAGQAPA